MNTKESAALSAPPKYVQTLERNFTAMASDIHLRVDDPNVDCQTALSAAETVFRHIEESCTRFDPDSSLMQANRRANHWCRVSPECFQAIALAHSAHVETHGRFDPRVLQTLQAQGYTESLDFESEGVVVSPGPKSQNLTDPAAAFVTPWAPGLDPVESSVRIGPVPIDLGGIGKGLAVRLAAQSLEFAGRTALVEAGGDCAAIGSGPDGDGWRIGIEDPTGALEPVAVVNVVDTAVATSSIRLRHWRVGNMPVHHLIDPSTGKPGGQGLLAVTVIFPDAAWAEVWSKSLFLVGAANIAEASAERGLAALWVDQDGVVGRSSPMEQFLIWERTDG